MIDDLFKVERVTNRNDYHFSDREWNIIEQNIENFAHNVNNDFKIERGDMEGFYVYVPAKSERYIAYCYSIEYLDGWFWGVVQGLNRNELKELRQKKIDNVLFRKENK